VSVTNQFRFGLGTSRLHYVSRSDRDRIIGAALDLGIRHFDTAPLYGDGLAERCLGEILQKKRKDVFIATKVGWPPNWLVDTLPSFSIPVRLIRAAGYRFLSTTTPRPPISAQGIRDNVRSSLRRLRTDYVDLLMLHEPAPEILDDPESVLETLLDLRASGLARQVGLAGAWDRIAALGPTFFQHGLIYQTNIDEWSSGSPPDIVYGVLSRGPQKFGSGEHLSRDQAVARLRSAVAKIPDAMILISTTNPSHLLIIQEI
jgi:Aldo/keto reductase family